MWGQFFDENELASITKYQQAPYQKDFYKDLILTYQKMNGNDEDYNEDLRQELKKNMMFTLFDSNPGHRNNNHNILMFHEVYPGVDKWINRMHDSIGKSRFSYILQRAESYLLLNGVCRKFHDKFPTIPIFTVHDAIITYKEYLPELESIVLRHFKEITGIDVGLKTKSEKPNLEPKLADINEEWAKIRPIINQKKFDDVRHGVFTSNIQRGAEFLKRSNS